MSTFPMTSPDALRDAQKLYEQLMASKNNGREMKALQLKRRSAMQAAQVNGQSKKATILNFNPVDLTMPGGLEQYKVQASGAMPADMSLRVKYKKANYTASYMTIEQPLPYTVIHDVKRDEGADMGDGQGRYNIALCRPIEIAMHIYRTYNEGAQDSLNMGGVVIYEGDKHVFRKAWAAFVDRKKPEEEERIVLQVPRFITLEDRNREYYVEEARMTDVLSDALDKQFRYYQMRMTLTQAKYDDPATRRDVDNVDRIWTQYGMMMGWQQSAPAWLNAQEDPEDACNGCGALRKRHDALFCGECNRPYDALKAYLANEKVDEAYLLGLPPEKLAIYVAEARRREDVRKAILSGGALPAAPAPAPPAPVASQQAKQEDEAEGGQEDGSDLEDMTLEQVKEVAKAFGIDVHPRHNKETLIGKIREAEAKQ